MPDTQEIRVRSAADERAKPTRSLKPADPCSLVIFGAAGDLTKRLVVPALYNLARTGLLPENFALIGVDRNDRSVEQWRSQLLDMLKSFVGNPSSEFSADRIDNATWNKVASRMAYVQGDFTKGDTYERVRTTLDQVGKAHGTRGNAIFYLAVADRFFGAVVDELGKAKL